MLALAISLESAAAQQNSILTYHGDASRSGSFVMPALTWEKARSVHLDPSFDARVAGHLYAQPLYWHAPGLNTAMLLVATEDGIVQAFDATTGKELCGRSVGRPVRGSLLPCGNINPLGITGTPVIDPSTQVIYFDAAVERASGPRHEVFGLSLKDGAILPGWPVDVADALQRSGRHKIRAPKTSAPLCRFSMALFMWRSAATSGIAVTITAGSSDYPSTIVARSSALRRALGAEAFGPQEA
jgi:hypothetical protein